MTSSYYERPIKELFIEMLDELLPGPGGIITNSEMVGWFADHYPRYDPRTIRAHARRYATNCPTRVHYNARSDGSDDLLYKASRTQFRRYSPATDPAPIYKGQTDEAEVVIEDVIEDAEDRAGEFAAEHHLRDTLAMDLSRIEPGLTLVGVEQEAGGRRIDILAKDANGTYLVIELKVSKAYDRVVGQLLRYRGWVSEHLAQGGRVRGLIVAASISEDLRLACHGLQDVELKEYALQLTITDA